MKFAKYSQNITACLAILWLAGCTIQSNQSVKFKRSEAVEARVKLALAYLEQNDFPKAKQNIDTAMKHDSNDYLPYSILAYYYQQIGNTTNAEKAYQSAIQLSQKQNNNDQASPDVLNNYGTFLCKQGKFEQAYTQFNLVLNSERPYYHQADTLENLALCAYEAGNNTLKKNALTQLIKLDTNRAEQLNKLIK
ncbi:type IV pilus biogenesis/stability protein PilW [Otariodibacter sp.]|uniref:type IV pilus biogenesis/stability protein PilW n=1 Tax=Otariodibacter sp. TaxID=3030919 RepID=UPI00261B3CDA|nr:type IV pilus biogenesis/stability protein PilW [Otariodibacter sp.]